MVSISRPKLDDEGGELGSRYVWIGNGGRGGEKYIAVLFFSNIWVVDYH